jgi:hypothetical protein
MNTSKSIYQAISSKFGKLSLSMFLTAAALLNAPSLDAGGWGTTKEVVEFENVSWDKVFFDMNDIYFTAFLPDYQSAQLKDGLICLYGVVGEAGYIITTSFNPGDAPANSAKKFLKIVKEANPEYIVNRVDSKGLGVKFAVDLTPVNQSDTAYWRFMSTNDRLIKMGTDDVSESRRGNFFDSFHKY